MCYVDSGEGSDEALDILPESDSLPSLTLWVVGRGRHGGKGVH